MAIESDVVIIGAGPVGLFQIFELGLQGIKVHVIDALPHAGGQCVELYPDKPIYDIPAVPVCTGIELIEKLQQQIAPFEPMFHFENEVKELQRQADGTFLLTTSRGLEFNCKAVIVAAGGGSFTPVRIRVEGLAKFENEPSPEGDSSSEGKGSGDAQLFYRVKKPAVHKNKHIVLLGGGDSALDWALALYKDAASMTVINRTERFRAAEASVKKLEALAASGDVTMKLGAVVDFREENGALSEIQVTLREEGNPQIWLPVEHLLVFFGMSPKIGSIEEWGLNFERKHITINPETFQTSEPGIYAIGDINTYPGKKKLILSGFHEAALTAYAVKAQLEPDAKVNVQYTTTSSVMQQRLGVQS